MAQAALTALDTWTARDWRKEERQWREEVRRWRADDVAFRAEERRFKTEERMFRAVRHRWRHEIMQQRHVDNAMHLWNRTKECNRRSVEEKAEHMRAMAWLAAIVGGFTMTAPVEFTYSDPDAPMALVTAYALCTALVLYVYEREEEEFLASALCSLLPMAPPPLLPSPFPPPLLPCPLLFFPPPPAITDGSSSNDSRLCIRSSAEDGKAICAREGGGGVSSLCPLLRTQPGGGGRQQYDDHRPASCLEELRPILGPQMRVRLAVDLPSLFCW
ncbi:unnamed protein product [Closterium sp. NIES-53]